MTFELTREFLDHLYLLLEEEKSEEIRDYLQDLHPVDIAEIIDEVNLEQAQFIYRSIDRDVASEVLTSLEPDVKNGFLSSLTDDEIAIQIEKMDSDDATDFIQDLEDSRKENILGLVKNLDQSADIAALLNYDEDTAGGLMAKEYIFANEHWTVERTLNELRTQANDIDHVYTIYVVNDQNRLRGTLSLKTFLYASNDTKIDKLFQDDPIAVKAAESDKEVVRLMEKYDLVVIPVINDAGVLLGRITIDDVVDVMKEDAEREMQLVTGVYDKVESKDSPWIITKARLPWLIIGLVGGVLGALVIGNFEGQLDKIPQLAFFIPLIAAMGGNIGVQSSALIVQGIANETLKLESTGSKILKELMVSLINASVLSSLIFGYNLIVGADMELCLTVSLALFSVVIFSGVVGTVVPLVLHKYKIDPALATGPFITTLNDILGLLVYFTIGYMIYP